MIIKDLGAVTAYAAAVEKGYTGTEEEFATLMASYATVAEAAAESAESASQSAESASASASTATQKASEATTAAQTATAKAEETQADADAAALDASQALSAASTATSKASEAAQSASDAVTAKTAAQTAQTAAEGSATTAQTAAQTATTKAAEAAESARTLTIDATLTQSGQAADAKVVGDKVDDLKSDLNEYKPLFNTDNLLKDPLFRKTFSDNWNSIGTPSISETNKLNNNVTITSEGTQVQITQDILLSDLVSGTYYVSCKTVSGERLKIQVTTRRATNYYSSYLVNTKDGSATFNLDIEAIQTADPLMVKLTVAFILANVGSVTLTQPYLGISNTYNEFWNKNFKYLEEQLAIKSPKLYGKSIYLDGDSICYGDAWTGGYGKILNKDYGMVVTNNSVSGATLADSSVSHNIAQSVIDATINQDYVIIEGGVNDRAINIDVGTVKMVYQVKYQSNYSDYDMDTYLGALEALFLKLRTDCAGKKVGFIIPHRIFQMNDVWYTTWVSGIKSACEKWGVPLLNLNDYAPLRMLTNLETTYCPDGWHPNEAGYRTFYIPHIVSWLESL